MGYEMANQLEPKQANISPGGCYSDGKTFVGNDYGSFLGIAIVGMLIAGVVPLVLTGPMFCGIGLCFLQKRNTGRVAFETLFKGFDYFVPSLIATLIYVGASIMIVLPAIVVVVAMTAVLGSLDGMFVFVGLLFMAIGYVALVGVMAVLAVIHFFACLLIVENKLDGLEAMKLAWRGFLQNISGVVLTAILGQLFMFLAAMLCVIPIFFVFPIVLAGHFVAYEKIFSGTSSAPLAKMV